jgi:RNA polymerase sigma factor (sigma-70 family)
MTNDRFGSVLHYLRRISPLRADEAPDTLLLERYAARRDEAAFAQVVRRHAGLVWGVCRRVLGQVQDAEDAFQATFLVLARKARAIRWRADVGNWLYAVAVRTALKARAQAVRRQRRERPMVDVPTPEPIAGCRDEVRSILDEELHRLPHKYRAPVVLHYLEGMTYAQAAEALGWAPGTVSSRLARARQLLRTRLTRRGVAVSTGSVAALLAAEAASGAAPAVLLETTIRAAFLSAAGKAGAAGLISARAALLTKGVLRAMLLTRLKVAAGLLLVLGLAGVGAGLFTQGMLAAGRPDPTARGGAADAPPGDKKDLELRKEVQRLTEELQKMQEKVSALENRLGPPGADAAPVLYQGKPAEYWIRSLKDRDPLYRVTAVKALGAIAEEEPRMIPVVAGALKDRDPEVIQTAAVALGALGPAAQPSIPALVEALKAEEHNRSWTAVENALYFLGPAAVPALAKVLEDTGKGAPRLGAARALAAAARMRSRRW